MPKKKTWQARLKETQDFIGSHGNVPNNRWVEDFIDFYLEYYVTQEEKQTISAAMAQASSANKPDNATDRSYRRALILLRLAQTKLQNYEVTAEKNKVNRLTRNLAEEYKKEVGALASFFKSKLDYRSPVADVRGLISWIWQRERSLYQLEKEQGDAYGTYAAKKFILDMPDALKYRLGAVWQLESKRRQRLENISAAEALLLLRIVRGQGFSDAVKELRGIKDSDLKGNLNHWLQEVRKDAMKADFDHLESDLSKVTNLLQNVKSKYDSTETHYRFEYIPNSKSPKQVKVINSSNNDVHLICNQGKAGSPEDLRKDKRTDGPDAEELITLGRQVIWIVRSLCPKGTFNNRLKRIKNQSNEKAFWPAYDRAIYQKKWQSNNDPTALKPEFKPIPFQLIWNLEDSPGWWNLRGEAIWEWLKKPYDDLQKAQKAKQQREEKGGKYLDTDIASILRKRRIADPEVDFLRDMAAKGMASYLSGGGVCAQLSHLTLGVLTLLAPPGTTIAQVYHSIDHSFVVITKGDATWFTVDPWAGDAYVCPWEESAFPPGGAAKDLVVNHFQMQVKKPVDIPYGVTFSAQHRDLAKQFAELSIIPKPEFNLKQQYQPAEALNLAQKGVTTDKVWAHLNGLKAGKEDAQLWKRGALLVALPENWGHGTINAVKRRLEQGRQALQTLSNQQSIAYGLARHRVAAFSKPKARKARPTRYEANFHTGNRLLDLERSLQKKH